MSCWRFSGDFQNQLSLSQKSLVFVKKGNRDQVEMPILS